MAEEDEEIYDDDDFYQVLLKELISKKSSNTEDPVAMTRHYIEMQKLKSKRARKKEIDNRASKDRKSSRPCHKCSAIFFIALGLLCWTDPDTCIFWPTCDRKLNGEVCSYVYKNELAGRI
ncbi:TRAUB domain protein [Cooperia oncophora]